MTRDVQVSQATKPSGMTGRISLHSRGRLTVLCITLLLGYAAVLTSIVLSLPWVPAFDASINAVACDWRAESFTPAVATFTNAACMAAIAIVALVVFIVLLAYKRRRGALIYAVSFLSGQAVMWATKYLVTRVRPSESIIPLPFDPSFPSGHSFSSLLLYALIVWLVWLYVFGGAKTGAMNMRAGANVGNAHGSVSVDVSAQNSSKSRILFVVLVVVVVVFIICMGLSRIYLGVHWPSDVLAGWLLAAGWFVGTLRVGVDVAP